MKVTVTQPNKKFSKAGAVSTAKVNLTTCYLKQKVSFEFNFTRYSCDTVCLTHNNDTISERNIQCFADILDKIGDNHPLHSWSHVSFVSNYEGFLSFQDT